MKYAMPALGDRVKMRWDYTDQGEHTMPRYKGGKWYTGHITYVDKTHGIVDIKFKDGDKAEDLNWRWAIQEDIVRRFPPRH